MSEQGTTKDLSKQRGFIDLRGAFYGMFIIGVLAGFALFVVVPWFWRLLKPWIHQVTGNG